LQAVLDDSNVNINTIAASKFVGPIKGKVDEWINSMEQFSKTFGECLYIYMHMLYTIGHYL